MIKKRERKDERKSSDGKDFVIKKPSGLIAKLAKKKKDMPAVPTEVPDMTDQEKSEIRKKDEYEMWTFEELHDAKMSYCLTF